MILEFLIDGTQEWVFVWVPQLKQPQFLHKDIDAPSVIVANSIADADKLLTRKWDAVRAIILMTNDDPVDLGEEFKWRSVIVGQQIKLPDDVKYSGEIRVENTTWIWSHQNQIIIRGKGEYFLTPRIVAQQQAIKLRIPDWINIDNLPSDIEVRRFVLWSLWIPRKIRINHLWDILVNPK
jgi:hypothetical protein